MTFVGVYEYRHAGSRNHPCQYEAYLHGSIRKPYTRCSLEAGRMSYGMRGCAYHAWSARNAHEAGVEEQCMVAF